MKRLLVLVSLLLPSVLVGCASDSDVRALRTDTLVLERQRTELKQTVEIQLQTLGERVVQRQHLSGHPGAHSTYIIAVFNMDIALEQFDDWEVGRGFAV